MKTLFEQLIREQKKDRFKIDTKDGWLKGWMLDDDHAFIKTVWIHKAGRGKGAGSKMVEKFEAWAKDKGAKVVRIEAEPDAIEFWEKMEYKVVKRGDKDTPSTMEKELKRAK